MEWFGFLLATGLGLFIVIAAFRCIFRGPANYGTLILVPIVALALYALPFVSLVAEEGLGPPVNHPVAYAMMASAMVIQIAGTVVAVRKCLPGTRRG